MRKTIKSKTKQPHYNTHEMFNKDVIIIRFVLDLSVTSL